MRAALLTRHARDPRLKQATHSPERERLLDLVTGAPTHKITQRQHGDQLVARLCSQQRIHLRMIRFVHLCRGVDVGHEFGLAPRGVLMSGVGLDAAQAITEGRSPHLWLVLLLVIEKPSHGYEIAQRYEERFGWLLPISSSRVYAALERLRADGLVEGVAERQAFADARSRGRRRLRATRRGAEAYRSWLARRMRDNAQRFELLGQLASVAVLGLRGAVDVLDRFEHECISELKRLPLVDERVAAGQCDAGELAQSLAADRQRRVLRADLDWAAEARKTVLSYAERHDSDVERGR